MPKCYGLNRNCPNEAEWWMVIRVDNHNVVEVVVLRKYVQDDVMKLPYCETCKVILQQIEVRAHWGEVLGWEPIGVKV